MKKLLKYLTSTQSLLYRIRLQVAIIIAELLVLALFIFWPAPKVDRSDQKITYSDRQIQLETPVITRHTSSPPPPPKPDVPPKPVPDDRVIEEEIKFTEMNLPDPIETSKLKGPGILDSNDDKIGVVSNPHLPPSVVKIVEAVMPKEAQKANIKAEIWVDFLVDENGNVENATISQIRKYDPNKEKYVQVDSIGYGLKEATLRAALQWKFRPAKQNGEKVRAHSKQVFTFGT